ncbi:MAG: gamma carbonic anhydrase family protein, partial [Burkholderiales bacterium]
GINAVVLNGARIGRDCLIGAGALITERMEIPERSLVLGTPGRVVRQLSDEVVARMRFSAAVYVRRAARYADELGRTDD